MGNLADLNDYTYHITEYLIIYIDYLLLFFVFFMLKKVFHEMFVDGACHDYFIRSVFNFELN